MLETVYTRLLKKMEQEQDAFTSFLSKFPAVEIIARCGEVFIRSMILCTVVGERYTEEQAKALLREEDVLAQCYTQWEKADISSVSEDALVAVIRSFADELLVHSTNNADSSCCRVNWNEVKILLDCRLTTLLHRNISCEIDYDGLEHWQAHLSEPLSNDDMEILRAAVYNSCAIQNPVVIEMRSCNKLLKQALNADWDNDCPSDNNLILLNYRIR